MKFTNLVGSSSLVTTLYVDTMVILQIAKLHNKGVEGLATGNRMQCVSSHISVTNIETCGVNIIVESCCLVYEIVIMNHNSGS